jgi:hypothetical protein
MGAFREVLLVIFHAILKAFHAFFRLCSWVRSTGGQLLTAAVIFKDLSQFSDFRWIKIRGAIRQVTFT